jgi:hypothetical protein
MQAGMWLGLYSRPLICSSVCCSSTYFHKNYCGSLRAYGVGPSLIHGHTCVGTGGKTQEVRSASCFVWKL